MSALPPSRPLLAVEAVARTLPRAPLSLLAERTLLRRRDWKFLLPLRQLPELLAGLGATHSVLWVGEEVMATYRTLYFDTPERACYHAHRRNLRRRYKVRVRSYPDREVTSLEVKFRTPKGETLKHRLSREYQDLSLDEEARAFIASHCDLAPEDLHPTIGNAFRRLTLLGTECDERITIDCQIAFAHEHSPRAEERPPQRLDGAVVVEVKSAAPRHETVGLQHMLRLGRRPQGMSKYCVGSALLAPDLRSHRFAPLLRQLARLASPSANERDADDCDFIDISEARRAV